MLTLIVNNKKPKTNAIAVNSVLPTVEFLQRKLRQLPLGDRKLGDVLDEAVVVFETPDVDAIGKSARLSDALRSVGVWLCHPLEDGDPPLHGLVAYPDRLVKVYPALKRNQRQLAGLTL